ncbi:hypothetical protein AB6A40_009085 [Gnathostoma spinigerum]|uniref:E3 ubiquitin-protein ligase PPP1R11 n=1 Tax=Gnathostoma spinigerum TaxID=75299 RepID=A0ABD6EY18_9BILA
MSQRTISTSSGTVTVTENGREAEPQIEQITLTEPDSTGPRVSWATDTVDNEFLNKKKSKCCCIYKKPKKWGEVEDDDDSDSECETGHCRGHVEKHSHPHDGSGDGGGRLPGVSA